MSTSQKSGSKPEKTMSSRLLTMKFMQRAAASAAAKESSQSPSVEDAGSHKRPRLSTDAELETPSQPAAELEAISAAVAAEEEKRKEAITRQAAEAGETEWVLDYSAAQYTPQPNVVAADSLDGDDDVITGGRRSYGNFKRKKTGAKETDVTDPNEIDSMIEKEKQKESKPVKLSRLTSISGGGHSGGGDSHKKRKHK